MIRLLSCRRVVGVLRTYVTRVWSYCMCGPEGQNFDNPVSVACVFRVCHDFHYPPGMYFGCVKHRVKCYLIWCTSTDNHVFRVLPTMNVHKVLSVSYDVCVMCAFTSNCE